MGRDNPEYAKEAPDFGEAGSLRGDLDVTAGSTTVASGSANTVTIDDNLSGKDWYVYELGASITDGWTELAEVEFRFEDGGGSLVYKVSGNTKQLPWEAKLPLPLEDLWTLKAKITNNDSSSYSFAPYMLYRKG